MSLVFDPSNPQFFHDMKNQFPDWEQVSVAVDSRGRVWLERPSCTQALLKLFSLCFRKSYNVQKNVAHMSTLATKKIQAHNTDECESAIVVIEKLTCAAFQSVSLLQKRKELIEACSQEYDLPPALFACQRGFFPVACELIDSWSDSYEPYVTLLLRASCEAQKFGQALLFARHGGALNSVLSFLLPLFHQALARGEEDIALQCMHEGVDITTPNRHNCPPLMISLERNLSRVSIALIERGSVLSFIDEEGRNYFHLAARHNMVTVAALMWQKQFLDLDVQDRNGMTPLMIACQEGNLEMVLFLRSCRADFTKVNHQGKTAFRLALESDCWRSNKEHMLQLMSHFLPEHSASYTWLLQTGPETFISHLSDFFHTLIQEQKRDRSCNCLESAFLLGCTKLADEITSYLSGEEYSATCLDLEKRYPKQASAFLFFSKYRLGARFHVGTLYQERAEFRQTSEESISDLMDLFEDFEFKEGFNPRFVNLPEMAYRAGLDQAEPEHFKKELKAFIRRIDKKKASREAPWNVHNQKQFWGCLHAAIQQIIKKIKDSPNAYIETSRARIFIELCLRSREKPIGELYNAIMFAWHDIVGAKNLSIQDRLDIILAEYRERIFQEMIGDGKKFLLNAVDIDRPISVFISAFAEQFRFPASHLRQCVTPFDDVIDRQKVIDTFYLNYTPKAIVEQVVMPLLHSDGAEPELFQHFIGAFGKTLTEEDIADGLVRMGLLKSRFSS